MRTRFGFWVMAAFAAGCDDGTTTADGGAMDAGLRGGGAWLPIAGSACNARQRNVVTQASPHVDVDASIAWLTNPPSSGPHFDVWTRWGSWPDVPRGHWVHNLEHGGVVFLVRCATGPCEAQRAAVAAVVAAFPPDPLCMPTVTAPARLRVVITNDREIATEVAGAAWGWLYAADCVDAASLRTFYTEHAGMAPENFCADGAYP